MGTTGFDIYGSVGQYASLIKAANYNFVGRYYSTNPNKNLTYSEAMSLTNARVNMIAIWEDGYPREATYFTQAQGEKDAQAAFNYALNVIKQPLYTPVYFTVDYGPSDAEIQGPITDYFTAVLNTFQQLSSGSPIYFAIGVYGSGSVCDYLLNTASLVTYTWLAAASAWSGYNTFTAYNIKQSVTTNITLDDGTQLNIDPDNSPQGNEGSFAVPVTILDKLRHSLSKLRARFS